jgi:hypothetical protein
VVAVAAGLLAGSVALVGFGVDSGIEVISAVALLWRLKSAGPHARAGEWGRAERRALYGVAATFFLLAVYIAYEATGSVLARETPDTSTVRLVLAVLSLAVMPTLAYAKQRTGSEMGSHALQADAVETWVCAYLSFALLLGVGLFAIFFVALVFSGPQRLERAVRWILAGGSILTILGFFVLHLTYRFDLEYRLRGARHSRELDGAGRRGRAAEHPVQEGNSAGVPAQSCIVAEEPRGDRPRRFLCS